MVRGSAKVIASLLIIHICQNRINHNPALIGCYKFMLLNFPSNVVKNKTQKQLYFLTKIDRLILVLFSPKCDWRKVEFNLDYFRQSGLFIEMQKSSTITHNLEIHNNYESLAESLCRPKSNE